MSVGSLEMPTWLSIVMQTAMRASGSVLYGISNTDLPYASFFSFSFMAAVPDLQYCPWTMIESLVILGYFSMSHMNSVKSGAECFSRQTLLLFSFSFQQKFLGLQSNSDSHSEPISSNGRQMVSNGQMMLGRHASFLSHSS